MPANDPQGHNRMPTQFLDGLGSTVFFAESYYACGNFGNIAWSHGNGLTDGVTTAWWDYDKRFPGFCMAMFKGNGNHNGWFTYPSTDLSTYPPCGSGGGNTASIPPIQNMPQGSVFQVRPHHLTECNWQLTQTQSPHFGGMNVALGDGSVRFLSGNISLAIWVAACDPRDGSVIDLDG